MNSSMYLWPGFYFCFVGGDIGSIFSKLCNQCANIFSSQQLKSIQMICSKQENNAPPPPPPLPPTYIVKTLLRGTVIGAEIANQGTRTLNSYLYEIWPTETWIEMKTL